MTDAELASGTSFDVEEGDLTRDIRVPEAPSACPDEGMADPRRSELRRAARFGERRTRSTEHSPPPSTTMPPPRVAVLPTAVQHDEPRPRNSALIEARPTPILGGSTCSGIAKEISRTTPLQVVAAHPGGPDCLTISSLRREDSTRREGVAHFDSRGDSDHSDEAEPPRVQPRAGHRRAAVRRRHHRSVEDANHNPNKTENLRSDEDNDIRQPLRKSRKANSRRDVSPRRRVADVEEEVLSSCRDSDSEWDTRPPRRKRRKLAPPKS